jgi:FixJ family two-component response regulator
LKLFDEHASEVDLLLTDVVMPQMHGPELAQRLVARRPELAVLFVSGYSDTLSTRTPTESHVAFLSKPFPHAQLVTTVAELLRARAV